MMIPPSSPLVFNSPGRVLVPATPLATRVGEGTATLLKSGEILLIYSRFTGGGADHDKADLYGGILDPYEGSLCEPRIFFQDETAVNQMNPGLERLKDGSLGIVYLRRTATDEDDIFFSRSTDEGVTWTPPVKVNEGCSARFIVVNNDRLRQFSSGRIAVPVTLFPHFNDQCRPASVGVFYSDDNGLTWHLSEPLKIRKENIATPHQIHASAAPAWEEACNYYATEQEPGVEELADGRIFLYCRTVLGYMYRAWSSDGGASWSPLQAATELVTPCGPQSIRRIPGTNRLVCIFNDRHHVAFADEEANWNWRTPLSIAVSDDGGERWRVPGNIEDESHNYCYASMLFLNDNLLLTYYESENSIKDGKPFRRSLASLKMNLVPLTALLDS